MPGRPRPAGGRQRARAGAGVRRGRSPTATFGLLAWVVILWLVVRILRGGDERLWLAVGLAAGVGLLNKWLPAFLLAGLAVGLLATPSARPALRSRWLGAGAALALDPVAAKPRLAGEPRLAAARDLL